ncbi:hypothetical protein PAXRUDRAFT_618724 [Paxillus rubicundulus Ve08.2h10]|uniref:Uncharacterized protein n=1 Tax=Paxillus rubicundulus Ve08.2h10 TaxID=930991 RepID=A0A0D0DVK9_9AGAM|nr:hypothetical protein PAXRUDRAFT_618724 [Paxillus rubicundulus Ve08.2h10]
MWYVVRKLTSQPFQEERHVGGCTRLLIMTAHPLLLATRDPKKGSTGSVHTGGSDINEITPMD